MTSRGKQMKKATYDMSLLEPEDRRIFDKDPTYYYRYLHKTKPCKKPRHSHDHYHATCPYWKKAPERRRNPLEFEYNNEPCVHVNPTRQQHYTHWGDPTSCPKGDKCLNSHNTLEAWGHPFQFRTRKCQPYEQGACPYGNHCVRAHGAQNLTNYAQIRQEVAELRRKHKLKKAGANAKVNSGIKIVTAQARPKVVIKTPQPATRINARQQHRHANGNINGMTAPIQPKPPHQNGVVAAPPPGIGAPPPPGIGAPLGAPPGIAPSSGSCPGIAPPPGMVRNYFATSGALEEASAAANAEGVINSLRETVDAMRVKNNELKAQIANFDHKEKIQQRWTSAVAILLNSRPPLDPNPNLDLKMKIDALRREAMQMRPKTLCKLCGKNAQDRMMSPCGHVCCASCESAHIKRDHTGALKCPFRQCKKRVDSVRTIYF